MVDLCTVDQIIRAIVDVVVAVDEANCLSPLEDLLGPCRICCVAGITSKTSGNLEKCAVRNGVLVVESSV